jgi:hypothetical protein
MIYFGIAQFEIEPQEGALHANQQPNNIVTHHEKSSMIELALSVFGCMLLSISLVYSALLCKISVPCSLSFPPFTPSLQNQSRSRPECLQRNTNKDVLETNSGWAEDHL